MNILFAVALLTNLFTIENYDAINSVVSVIVLITTLLMSLHFAINLYGGEGE